MKNQSSNLSQPIDKLREKMYLILSDFDGEIPPIKHEGVDRYDTAVTTLQALITAEKKKLLEGLLEKFEIPEMVDGQYWPCKCCGFDGEEAQQTIEEEIKKLNQVPSEDE